MQFPGIVLFSFGSRVRCANLQNFLSGGTYCCLVYDVSNVLLATLFRYKFTKTMIDSESLGLKYSLSPKNFQLKQDSFCMWLKITWHLLFFLSF